MIVEGSCPHPSTAEIRQPCCVGGLCLRTGGRRDENQDQSTAKLSHIHDVNHYTPAVDVLIFASGVIVPGDMRIAITQLLIWMVLIGLFPAADTTLAATETKPASAQPSIYQRDDVLAIMKRVLNFQVKAYGDKAPVTWQAGAFWAGVGGAMQATNDPAFHDAAKNWGEKANWKLAIDKRPFHSDSIAAGQMYLDLYRVDKDPKMIEGSRLT